MTQGLSATPKLSLRTFAPYLELLFAAFSPPQKSWIHLGIPSFSKTYVMFFLHNNFQYSGVFLLPLLLLQYDLRLDPWHS